MPVGLYDPAERLLPAHRLPRRSRAAGRPVPVPDGRRPRGATLDWPSQFEQLWPIDAQGDYVVLNDDRLVVLTQDPSGDPVVLFDGFAQIPQVDLFAQHQTVTFAALGAAIRLWDQPILGRTQRDGQGVEDTSGDSDVYVHLPCRWNPSDTSIGSLGGYVANAIGADYDTEFRGRGGRQLSSICRSHSLSRSTTTTRTTGTSPTRWRT